MPMISNVERALQLSDVGTRIRVKSTVGTPIQITIPTDAQVAWPDGAWVEVVYLGGPLGVIDIVGQFGVTVNQLTGTSMLRAGEYLRVLKVSGVANTWDLHVYPLPAVITPSVDGLIAFSVGIPSTPHQHIAILTSTDAATLVNGTSKMLPVGHANQPIIYIDSDPGGLPQHIHTLGIQFDYKNNTFICTSISNNSGDNHVAAQIGVFRTPVYKPAPLTVQTSAALSNEVGSALHHNTSFRMTGSTAVSVVVRADSYWSGTQEYWEEDGAPSSPGPMPIGGSLLVGKHGTGDVTFSPGPGVTINTPDTLAITRLHGKAMLTKVGPNEWDLEGNIGA